MSATASQPDLSQDCLLDYLQQALDLVQKTAQAASAEANHRVVLQAIREGTRIVTLILKMTRESEPAPRAKPRPQILPGAKKKEMGSLPALSLSPKPKTGSPPPAMGLPDLGPLLQTEALTGLDDSSLNLLEKMFFNAAGLPSLLPESACGQRTSGPVPRK